MQRWPLRHNMLTYQVYVSFLFFIRVCHVCEDEGEAGPAESDHIRQLNQAQVLLAIPPLPPLAFLRCMTHFNLMFVLIFRFTYLFRLEI